MRLLNYTKRNITVSDVTLWSLAETYWCSVQTCCTNNEPASHEETSHSKMAAEDARIPQNSARPDCVTSTQKVSLLCTKLGSPKAHNYTVFYARLVTAFHIVRSHSWASPRWNLWCTRWQWDRSFPQHFKFTLYNSTKDPYPFSSLLYFSSASPSNPMSHSHFGVQPTATKQQKTPIHRIQSYVYTDDI